MEDIEPDVYLNHTYLKEFKSFGFEYNSLKESKFLHSNDNNPVENEFHIN